MRYSLIPTVVAAGLLVLSAAQRTAHAVDAETILAGECASCHDLTGPAPTTIESLVNREAPDLFYAGSKFRREWLVTWLQEPTRIRPAGTMFLNHIVSQDGKDRIAEETAKLCAARLDADSASAVADLLMTFTDETMKSGIIDPAKEFPMSKARLLFTKQLPCGGCHQIRFGKRISGGVSGPLLTEAGRRLNPDWIYARIENPQHWDPKTWMPKIGMSHAKRELLTLLIASMK